MKLPLMHILELSMRRWHLYWAKRFYFCLSCSLISLLALTSTCFQNKNKGNRKGRILHGAGLIKWFFSPGSRERVLVPRVPVSTLNDTPAVFLSGEPLFTRHRKKKKEKITRKVKTLSFFPLFCHLWCSSSTNLGFLFVFVAPCKWKHVRRSREKWGTLKWKERVESEQGSTGAVFIKTAMPERGDVEHLVNVLPTVQPCPNT